MNGKLILQDGSTFEGQSFGAEASTAGEMVFATGMVGYPESFTDPSFAGQILVLTYPIIGNYGVPDKALWESDHMQIKGLIVSQYIDTPSHFQSQMTLSQWLKKSNIPALEIKDTRLLAQKLRDKGAMLGKIEINKTTEFHDPNTDNLVADVSTQEATIHTPHSLPGDALQGKNHKTVVLIDCGAKRNIQRSLLKRGVHVVTVPWDFDLFDKNSPYLYSSSEVQPSREVSSRPASRQGGQARTIYFNGLIISNGPGDPKMADKTIATIQKALGKKIPILGICLGNQLLALAAGGDTSKLKFGHRSQNQPCIQEGTKRCYITTQNHGFHVSRVPKGFKPWFVNANDSTNEGIIHERLPFMSVQFHPEATPGPVDTEWIFDYFLERIR